MKRFFIILCATIMAMGTWTASAQEADTNLLQNGGLEDYNCNTQNKKNLLQKSDSLLRAAGQLFGRPLADLHFADMAFMQQYHTQA